jgi:hypothetical protein
MNPLVVKLIVAALELIESVVDLSEYPVLQRIVFLLRRVLENIDSPQLAQADPEIEGALSTLERKLIA